MARAWLRRARSLRRRCRHEAQRARHRTTALTRLAAARQSAFYPWLHETSSFHERARTVAQKHAHHVSVFGASLRFVAAHSRARTVWLTEAGNIDPIAVADMTRGFVAPLRDGLESLSAADGPVSRWY